MRKRVVFYLDDEYDLEMIDWIKTLPRGRLGGEIRTAIKSYIAAKKNVPIPEAEIEKKTKKKKYLEFEPEK